MAQKWWQSNRSSNLDREVVKAIKLLPLANGQKDELECQWHATKRDAEVTGLLSRLLVVADLEAEAQLGQRFHELLSELDLLLGVEATAKQLTAVVLASRGLAQPDARQQSALETSILLDHIDNGTTAPTEVERVIATETEATAPRLPQPDAPPRLLFSTDLGEGDQRVLSALTDDLAARLADLVQAGEAGRWSSLLDVPPAWAEQAPAVFWEAVHRLAMSRGLFDVALRASVRESEDVTADRVAAFARAAAAEDALDHRAEALAYLRKAESLDPAHPALLLQRAGMAEEHEERLRLAESAEPRTERQHARKAAELAYAHLGLGDYDKAADAADRAAALDPGGAGVEAQHLVRVMRAQREFPARPSNPQQLLETARYFGELADKTATQGRWAASEVSASRRALALSLAGEADQAMTLVEAAIAKPPSASEAARNFGQAATLAGRPDRAVEAFPRTGLEGDRYNLAAARVVAGVDTAEAVAELDLLVQSTDPDIVQAAAFSRLIASHDPAVSLPEHLADQVENGQEVLDQARAARAVARDDLAEADRIMSRYDDPASLAMRISIATRRDRLPRAVQLAERLQRVRDSGTDRLRLARLRGRARDFAGAGRDALTVAENPDETDSLRREAFGLAASAANDQGDMPRLQDVAEAWRGYAASDENLWWLVFAHLRQQQPERALDLLNRFEPAVTDDFHAFLWVQAAAAIDDVEERLALINQLSESRGRPERLEFALISAALAREDVELDPELEARIRQSLAEFGERFPDSQLMQSVSFDQDDPGAFIAELERLNPADQERKQQLRTTLSEVAAGTTTLAVLAAMLRRSTIEVLTDGRALPLAFADRDARLADQDGARRALELGAASWDATALAVAGGLADNLGQRLRELLLTSRVGQMTFDDVAGVVSPLVPSALPTQTAEATRRASELAAQLTLTSDTPSGASTTEKLREALKDAIDDERTPLPFRALAGSIAVALVHGLPFYSDDRAARALARGFGLVAFGTLALVRELVASGDLSSQAAATVRNDLLAYGAWTDELTRDDVIALIEARSRRWDAAGAAVFSDAWAARQPPRGRVDLAVDALLYIGQEAPELLWEWAEGVLHTFTSTLSIHQSDTVRFLLGKLLEPGELIGAAQPTDYARVVRTLRQIPPTGDATPVPDPLLVLVAEWLGQTTDEVKAALFRFLLTRLDAGDQELLRQTFTHPEVTPGAGEAAEAPDAPQPDQEQADKSADGQSESREPADEPPSEEQQ